MRRVRLWLICGLSVLLLRAMAHSLPPGFEVETVMDDLNFPVSFDFAPDGRIFFNELRTGKIRIIQDGQLLPQPFATLDVATAGEQGLLGLALDPNFRRNPFVYVYHTQRSPLRNRVVRFTDAGNRGVDQFVVLDNLPVGIVHNGGIIGFGPDKKLYITIGDTTVRESAQDIEALSGKIFRLNPDGTIPDDNPFPGSPVYALGLRNSFGFAFDPLTKMMFATDNGPECCDELNRIVPGGNYGWPIVLGIANDPRFINPLADLGRIAPTGVAFYRGKTYPRRFRHDLFFCDFNTGRIHRVKLNRRRNAVRRIETFHEHHSFGLLDIQTGPDGNLWFSSSRGIFRIVLRRRR